MGVFMTETVWCVSVHAYVNIHTSVNVSAV